MRINKFFTEQGLCSRREADRLIAEGRVTINGRVAKLGDQVSPEDAVARDGVVLQRGQSRGVSQVSQTGRGDDDHRTACAAEHHRRDRPYGQNFSDRTARQRFLRPHSADERRRHRQ
jgi:ribosomal 50S subunit-recycling heat shock protein